MISLTRVGAAALALAVLSATPSFAQEEEAAADESGLLQKSLDDAGMDEMTANGLTIGGHAEASWTYSFDDPDSDEIAGRAFDFEHNEGVFNQLLFYVDRQTDASVAWDIGGRFEFLFGADARFTPSNGLFNFDEDEVDDDTEYDITQAYVEVVLPVGNGIKTKLGKFATPLGYELVDASGNTFYSHNFLFNLVPFSHTGVLMSYDASDQWTIGGGFSRGWDQTCDDNNEAIDGIGVITFNASEATSMTLSFTIGPEQAENEDDWRYAFNYYITHQASDQLMFAAEGTWILDENGDAGGDNANTYGICGYIVYTINDMFDIAGRAEWVSDDERDGGLDTDVYEVTAGLQIHPFPNNDIGSNLIVRPEVRYDMADDDVFDDESDDSQITFAVDAIFTF